MAISSTGRSSPHGRDHWAGVGSWTAVFVHGRGPEPRLRERQATPTPAWPVAMAIARCPTVAQLAPPPKPIWEKNVTSPAPMFLAISTSSVVSIV
jgi:hypothetical protein